LKREFAGFKATTQRRILEQNDEITALKEELDEIKQSNLDYQSRF
jgi:hypothetical protein